MKSSPFALKQKLSSKAAAAKKRRDIAMAKTPARKAKKAENQRIGQRSDSDLHHTGSAVKRVSIKDNRGNFGKGTKNETKSSGFKMRSGNRTSFKMMGSSPMRGENIQDWRMVKKGGGDWEKVYRKPKGLATSRSGGQYFDDWGKPATYGMEEVDANLKKSTQSRIGSSIMDARGTGKQILFGGKNRPDPLSNLSTEDFWSQYSF